MLEITQVTEESKKEWMEFANLSKGTPLCYDYRWKHIIEESFGHKSFYLMAREKERVRGIFPLIFISSRITKKALISVPFLNYGGILAEDKDAASFLLEKAIDVAKKVGAYYVEARNLVKEDIFPVTREHKVTMWLDLASDINAQWDTLSAKVRNQIRKGQKSGLTIDTGKQGLISDFYRVFSQNMRDLGTPVVSKNFFKNILKYFPEESTLFVVRIKNKPVAGAFTLSSNGIMEIPWASSIRAFNKLCPNEFMYWEAIKAAISKGFRRFDFGRCTKETGTYRFKKQWDPVIKQLYWQYWPSEEKALPADSPQKSKYKFLAAVWKKLPLSVANSIGPRVAKEITAF